MFNSISDCRERYKEEISRYNTWSDARFRQYGSKANPSWRKDDFEKAQLWDAEIRGMEKVLGLGEAEIARIQAESNAQRSAA